MDKTLLNAEEAAARLGITVRHLRNLHERRELPFVRVGRLKRWDPADLDAYIEAQRQEAIS